MQVGFIRRWLIAVLVLLSGGFVAVANAGGTIEGEIVRLEMRNGDVFTGRVFDLRDDRLEVNQRLGRKIYPKREVRKWSYTTPQQSSVGQSILMLERGHSITGKLDYDSTAGRWVVALAAGKSHYDAAEVLRAVQPSGQCSDGAFTPRGDFEASIEKAIERALGDDALLRAEGERVLAASGFFALSAMERVLGERDDPHGVLTRRVTDERLRVMLPDQIAADFPKFFERLSAPSADGKLALVKDVYSDRGAKCHGLFSVLLLDARQPSELRSFALDALQRAHDVELLIEAYRRSRGRGQFALAIGLGDIGIHIGLPTLIEALGVDDLEVRSMAAMKLKEYTDEDFGYRPQEGEAGLKTAQARWEGFWREHRDAIERQLAYLLSPDLDNPKRLKAAAMWREANVAWASRDAITAEALYKSALQEDPTSLPPLVCLGMLKQQEGKFEEAIDWYRQALRRNPRPADAELLRLAYYQLGKIHELGFDYDVARQSYQKAVEIDPDYAEAWLDLGTVIYQGALRTRHLSAEERRERLEDAVRTYEEGLGHLVEYRQGLIIVRRRHLPVGVELPFSTREHNQSLRELKRVLVLTEARFHYNLARVTLALGDRAKAKEWVGRAIESPQPSADHYLFRAQLLRAEGELQKAEEDVAKARELDPEHRYFN